jgi:hypothetical protein
LAIEQAHMYREDIRDLTAVTVAKQDLYHIVGVIFYVITIQLIMAGRLGVHGPVPSGWLMGIHYTCCGQLMMWLTLSTWLAMHAAARAKSGEAHMLTRSVRLPIPTPQQLDKARKFGNTYESQNVADMVRLPWLMPAPKDRDSVDEEKGKKGGLKTSDVKIGIDGDMSRGTGPQGGARRLPRWYQDDEATNLHGTGTGGTPTTPVHFELYRGLQQEWVFHDTYARISLFYFMTHWFFGAAYYIQSHCFGELRAIWPAWSCSIVLSMANFCLLKIDLYGDAVDGFTKGFPVEHVAPWMPMLTVFGLSLDYSIIEPNNGTKAFIYVVAWIVYAVHFAFALRLYDAAIPKKQEEMPDMAGQPWWPGDWWTPPAFQHALNLLAPPKQTLPGQTCLQQEMFAAKKGTIGQPQPKARESLAGHATFPWKIFRGGCFTMLGMWCLIIVGRVIEQLHGERALVKQEGRVERWPSHMQPWMPPWNREYSSQEWCHTGGCDRRLQSQPLPDAEDQRIAAVAQKLSSVLAAVSETLDHELAPREAAAAKHMAPPVASAPLRQARVAWPDQLSPSILACNNDGSLMALTRDTHTGASVRLPLGGEDQEEAGPAALAVQAQPFALRGLEAVGGLLGASWGEAGLLVATTNGAVAECAGRPLLADATWPCREVATRLPMGGSRLRLAAAARHVQGHLRAAVVFDEDEFITLFEHADDGSWDPIGEVRLPNLPGGVVSFSMADGADELLISAKQGGVIRWPLDGASPVLAATPHSSSATFDLTWHATCGVGNNLAHLASRANAPQLYVSARA